jgi:hypothetical protein
MAYDLYDPNSSEILADASFNPVPPRTGTTALLGYPNTSDTALAQYIGLGTLSLEENISRSAISDNVALNGECPFGCSNETPQLSITYDYTPAAVGTTPLPGGLPLFMTGLGGLGLLGWRRQRKNTAATAA